MNARATNAGPAINGRGNEIGNPSGPFGIHREETGLVGGTRVEDYVRGDNNRSGSLRPFNRLKTRAIVIAGNTAIASAVVSVIYLSALIAARILLTSSPP